MRAVVGEPDGLAHFQPRAGCLRCLVYGQPAEDEIRYSILEVLVGLTGLEPVTLRLSSACSNQLSYRPCVSGPARSYIRATVIDRRYSYGVETRGFEPLTYSLQSYRSTN